MGSNSGSNGPYSERFYNIPESEIGNRFNNQLGSEEGNYHQRLFDYIIVGAGSAGCALASHLVSKGSPGRSVLLLEAGIEAQHANAVRGPNHFPLLWRSEADWKYRSTPSSTEKLLPIGRRIDCERGKVLGGSSSLNYMMYVRGTKQDFDIWENEESCDGWGFDSVRKNFENVEQQICMSVPSPLPPEIEKFKMACESENISRRVDTNGTVSFGVANTLQSVLKKGRVRSDAFTALLEPLLDSSPNLTVISCAMVTKVIIEQKANKNNENKLEPVATGVEVVMTHSPTATGDDCNNKNQHQNNAIRFSARREVILCAGAINSPQLLMLSGIGDKRHLRSMGIQTQKHAPAVGKNLMDHPGQVPMGQVRVLVLLVLVWGY